MATETKLSENARHLAVEAEEVSIPSRFLEELGELGFRGGRVKKMLQNLLVGRRGVLERVEPPLNARRALLLDDLLLDDHHSAHPRRPRRVPPPRSPVRPSPIWPPPS